ncbi:MAG: hypothetical protein KDJ36_12060 [Hyphomicrobiaceae bacterium]|nr:hypothetical protein [Hyphomicrobiaceae bacterium]
MVFWMLTIAFSVVFLVISAAAGSSDPQMVYVHMSVAALVSIVFALISVRDTRQLITEGAPRNAVYASTIRFMGLLWTWGALALVITYGTGILDWPNWMPFFVAFFVAAGLCMFISSTLRRDLDRGEADDRILQLGGYLTAVQLIGMVAAVVAISMSGGATIGAIKTDTWAANQVFLFGALALAAISAYTLKASIGDAR